MVFDDVSQWGEIEESDTHREWQHVNTFDRIHIARHEDTFLDNVVYEVVYIPLEDEVESVEMYGNVDEEGVVQKDDPEKAAVHRARTVASRNN